MNRRLHGRDEPQHAERGDTLGIEGASPHLGGRGREQQRGEDREQPRGVAEVRGVTARQGYIVSELSPGEFTALQATQKAREAARKAWEQARAVSDYLRNI